MAREASIRPWSTSRIAASMIRAMKGVAATRQRHDRRAWCRSRCRREPGERDDGDDENDERRRAAWRSPRGRGRGSARGASNSSPRPLVARNTPSGRPSSVPSSAATATMYSDSPVASHEQPDNSGDIAQHLRPQPVLAHQGERRRLEPAAGTARSRLPKVRRRCGPPGRTGSATSIPSAAREPADRSAPSPARR